MYLSSFIEFLPPPNEFVFLLCGFAVLVQRFLVHVRVFLD